MLINSSLSLSLYSPPTYHIESLVGVLIMLALVQRTMHIREAGPIAAQVIGHGMYGIQESIGDSKCNRD